MATLEELKADIKRNQDDAVALFDPTGQHVKNSLWPFLESLAEFVEEGFTELHGRIVDLEEGEAELLYEETGTKIIEALEIGAALAVALTKAIGANPNEAGKKLLAAMVRYHEIAKEIVPHVQSITLEDSDEEEEDDEDAIAPPAEEKK